MLKNRDHTPAFDEFLELLGDKVELQGWEGYNGGLDTSSAYSYLVLWGQCYLIGPYADAARREQDWHTHGLHLLRGPQRDVACINTSSFLSRRPTAGVCLMSWGVFVFIILFYPYSCCMQLERKRHIGNDVVTLVFKEGNTPFNPACLTSQFTRTSFTF